MARQAIVSAPPPDDDQQQRDVALRPKLLREVIGQRQVVERLGIVLKACKKLKEPVPHVLFDGPPGLGKTTFATVLPNELGTAIQMTSGPALAKPADLLPFLTNLDEGSIPVTAIGNVNGLAGGTYAGNISVDPLFANYPTNLHLGSASLCIDAGTSTGAPLADFEGTVRSNPPDIGADERLCISLVLVLGHGHGGGDKHCDGSMHISVRGTAFPAPMAHHSG